MKKKKNQVKASKRSANQSLENFLNNLELHELDAKQIAEILGGSIFGVVDDKFHGLKRWAWDENNNKGWTISGVVLGLAAVGALYFNEPLGRGLQSAGNTFKGFFGGVSKWDKQNEEKEIDGKMYCTFKKQGSNEVYHLSPYGPEQGLYKETDGGLLQLDYNVLEGREKKDIDSMCKGMDVKGHNWAI